jgi:predicted RNA-binding protein (virulence factor B family)
MKSVPALAELTNQRVSALVRQLKENGSVIRTEEKRKAYFEKVA